MAAVTAKIENTENTNASFLSRGVAEVRHTAAMWNFVHGAVRVNATCYDLSVTLKLPRHFCTADMEAYL